MKDLNRHGGLRVSTSAYGSLAKKMAKIGESEGLRKTRRHGGHNAVSDAVAKEGNQERDNREQATKLRAPPFPFPASFHNGPRQSRVRGENFLKSAKSSLRRANNARP